MGISKTFSSKSEYTMSYSGMRGVNFLEAEGGSSRNRFAYLENMYRDYESESADVTESIPGYRRLFLSGAQIHAFYFHKHSDGRDVILVHSGSNLFYFFTKDIDTANNLTFLCNMKNKKSCGFSFGTDFYIFDSSRIVRINSKLECTFISEETPEEIYIPTTFVNAEAIELRNILTDLFREEYTVGFADDLAYCSDGLLFRITDSEKMYCEVVGIDEEFESNVYIPKYAKIGNSRYRVMRIAENAFNGVSAIYSIYVAEGVTEIGSGAMSNISGLRSIHLADSIEHIGDEAFANCPILSDMRLGASLHSVGNEIFASTPQLDTVKYAKGKEEFYAIENISIVPKKLEINYNPRAVKIEIPLSTTAFYIEGVTVGGSAWAYEEKTEINSDVVRGILLYADRDALEGKHVVTTGHFHYPTHSKSIETCSLFRTLQYEIPSSVIVYSSRVCECFDGRIFISGFSEAPNAVLYSSRDRSGKNNPLYFSIANYFEDGIGRYPVASMLAVGNSLAVFKKGDDGSGSIFYHTPTANDSPLVPKIYPVSYVHSGVCALGASISFYDDPLFISPLGVTALDKEQINYDRNVSCRSGNVNSRLLSENLEQASLASWCGYLAVLTDGRIYLADSRQTFRDELGKMQYEWYFLSGIGSYFGDESVFRYSSEAPDGYEVHESMDDVVEGEVLNVFDDIGNLIYYTVENGIKYRVYRTSEKKGGTFYPAKILASDGNGRLFFGTENGDICIFNNDRRGKKSLNVMTGDSIDEENYKLIMGRRIHPDYYNFAGHAPKYVISTVSDNCGMPHFTKNTVKNSLTARIKCYGKGNMTVDVETNAKGYKEIAEFTDSDLDFSNINFSSFSFYTDNRLSIPTAERERGWCEKRITVSSNKANCPLGIYSLTYRFTIKGPVKKKL